MAKRKITIDEAQALMYNSLNVVDFGDKVYELAQDIFQGFINVIETKCEIEGVEEYLDSDQAWYDEIQEDFYQQVYDKLTEFLLGK
jgi:hypothetical protein